LPGPIFQEARQFGLDECIIIEREEIRPLVVDSNSQSINQGHDSKVGKHNSEGNDAGEGVGGGGGSPAEDIQSLVTLPISSSSSNTTSKRSKQSKEKHHEGNNHNPQGYIVATQDETLSDILRSIPNVPQMHLSRAVLMFESPSAATRRKANYRERGKQMTGGGMMTVEEREFIVKTKREERTKRREVVSGQDGGVDGVRRKRKAKGPNPLSCKKKKGGDRKSGSQNGNSNTGLKDKRNRRNKTVS